MNMILVDEVDEEIIIIIIDHGGHIVPNKCRGTDWGWAPEPYMEFTQAVRMLKEALRLKTPGVQEGTVKVLHEFVQRQIEENFGDAIAQGAVLVL
jgi:hypothetical protein